jgi:hypothetical protein
MFGACVRCQIWWAAIALFCILLCGKRAEAEGATLTWAIKPRVCVYNASESLCRLMLDVQWHSTEAQSLCLYRQDQEAPLVCWTAERAATAQIWLETAVTLDLTLRSVETQAVVAHQTLEVTRQSAAYRRARRNAWAFF